MFELWRIIHTLTGRHFVHLDNGTTEMIRMVRFSHRSRPYVKWHSSKRIWLDSSSSGEWRITALTSMANIGYIGN